VAYAPDGGRIVGAGTGGRDEELELEPELELELEPELELELGLGPGLGPDPGGVTAMPQNGVMPGTPDGPKTCPVIE
jgi:hypothetical protein